MSNLVRSLHSASTVPLQLQPSHSCNEETKEQIDNIACVTLTPRSPSWGWFVVTQNVPVYMFEAPSHLTNIWNFTAYRKFRVWKKCGYFIDVRAGDMCIATAGERGKLSLPVQEVTVSLTDIWCKFHVCRLSITSQLFIHSTRPPYKYNNALRSESTGCSEKLCLRESCR